MALGWLGPRLCKSWATKNNFTKQKLWIKTIGSQRHLKVGTNQTHKWTGWYGKYMRVPAPSLTSLIIFGRTYVSHAVDDSYQPFSCSRGYQSVNLFEQFYVMIIATMMSFHLSRISNFNDTFPPKSCHFLTRVPCPSSESAINRWTSESWKFRNVQFGEAQWIELLLTQFI